MHPGSRQDEGETGSVKAVPTVARLVMENFLLHGKYVIALPLGGSRHNTSKTDERVLISHVNFSYSSSRFEFHETRLYSIPVFFTGAQHGVR